MKNFAFSVRIAAKIACTSALALAACAGTDPQVQTAQQARYKGDKLAIYTQMKQAVLSKYQIAKSDENEAELQTTGRWFTPEGLSASERGDMRDVPNRSLNIVFDCKLVADGDAFRVKVTPVYLRYFAGRPNPDSLAPDDPSIPGFATGKVEALTTTIHDYLKTFELQSLPAQPSAMPPPSASPVAPPAAPAGGGY